MVKRIEGVSSQLIESAKTEFLAQGYERASLRGIAAKAGTSTNSIYVRFGGKTGLFDAIVQPVAEEVLALSAACMGRFRAEGLEMSFDDMVDFKTGGIDAIMDYVYDHFDEFKLLLCCSPQGEPGRFIKRLVQADVGLTMEYIGSKNATALESEEITGEFVELLTTTYYNGFFEPVRCDMDRDHANDFVRQLRRFFSCGYRDVIVGQVEGRASSERKER